MNSSQPTYCSAMKKGPWKARHFDWHFAPDIAYNSPEPRNAIITERQKFERNILKELNFDIPPPKNVKNTRNLTKDSFLQEMHDFKRECTEGPCGCVWVAVSSHGVIVKKDEHVEKGGVAIYEDYILTHPDPEKTEYSINFVEERVSLREIVDIFRDKQLKGIPKIFFVQACRDKPNDQGAHIGKDLNVDRGVMYDEVDGEKVLRVPITSNLADSEMAYSPPHLEDTVIVFSTPFSRVAGFNLRQGSHVWDALGDTLKELQTRPEPVNLLRWLRKTNQNLQKGHYAIDDDPYKPLLSICHTLTKHVEFKKAE